MKKALLLCVISALLPCLNGVITTCADCTIKDTICDKTCKEDGVACIAIQESSTLDPNISGIYRSCISPSQCKPLAITLSTSSQRHIQSTTACCEADYCNANLSLSETPTGNFKNGVNCPVCESENKTQCESTTYIACTGLEEKCISLVGTSIADPAQNFSLKGCASRNACDMKENDLMAYKGVIYNLTTKAICTGRGTLSALSSPAAIFLPAMVGYLFVNVLP